MAIIHDSTLSPGKRGLLAGWRPDGTQVRATLAAAQHVQLPATR